MVRNSAKLDRRTKQHTQFGVSTSDGSRDMARTKSWRKKRKKKRKKKNERGQNHIASPTGIAKYVTSTSNGDYLICFAMSKRFTHPEKYVKKDEKSQYLKLSGRLHSKMETY